MFEKLKNRPEIFKRLVGVSLETFLVMVEVVKKKKLEIYASHSPGGAPHHLSIEDEILLALWYLRVYSTYFYLGIIFHIGESSSHRISKFIENILIKCDLFNLPSRSLTKENFEKLLLDATEVRIERPKRGQRKFYSGKKKSHTLKSQVFVDKKSKKILSVDVASGKTHDFKIFKQKAKKRQIHKNTELEADKGYIGIEKFHEKSFIPKKKKRKEKLSKEDSLFNRAIASSRQTIEHVFGHIKSFKILSTKYRNRRKRFGLRFNLIAGIYNYELCQAK